MRFLLGLIVGIALTLGAAYVHDINLPPPAPVASTDPGAPPTARRIVDWDALGAIVDAQTAFVRETWNKIFR